jgi:hypothetical protein
MRKTLALVWMLGLAACSPSINPQMKAATDSLASSFQSNSRTVAPPSAYQPMPWAVGQWIVQRNIDEKGNVTVTHMGIVGQDAGGIWVELESQDYFHHNITKLLFTKMPTNPDEVGEVLSKAIMKTDDKDPQTMDFSAMGPLGSLQKTMFKSVMKNIVITTDLSQVNKEDATVPAGTFVGCAKISAELSFAGMTQKSTTWFHPAVPLNGGVKGQSTDGKWKMELLDYGTTGATSKL